MAREVEGGSVDPGRKYGGLFGDVTGEGPVMYFGGGRNTTKTHFDPFDNLMLVVDGCEQNAGCKYKELGQTFYETAALMSKLGAYQAVMVDGGGSSTACEPGNGTGAAPLSRASSAPA